MRKILLAIQEQLQKSVEELKYIDKDWGQLGYEQPPLKYPCALLDISNVEYVQLSAFGAQRAEVTIEITVCYQNLIPASAASPRRKDGFHVFCILNEIHHALQMFQTPERDFTPLLRTATSKQTVTPSVEVYTMYYKTRFTTPVETKP